MKNKEMRKYFILLLALAIMSNNTLNAQIFKGMVSVGVNIAQMNGDEVSGFKHMGFTGGLGIMMPFNEDKPNEGFAASMELLFTQRGAKNTNIQDPFKYDCTLSYIDIPVMFHYMDTRAKATVGLGVQYSRLVKTKESWQLPDPKIIGMDRPVNIDDHDFLKNDFAAVVDFRFTIWKHFKFDARWQHSLIPIREDFVYDNSYGEDYQSYRTWKRDFKSHYLTFKVIYVLNEQLDQPQKKTRRRGAY